jgi:hypothetical protein
MNNPMSRKLFQDREAREKLRGMGGILASSPELSQTVAKFQDGTLVEAPSTAAERRRQGYLIFLQQMGLPDTPQSREMYTRMMERQATAQLSATPRLAGAGVDMSPAPVMLGQDAGQNALGRLRPTQFVATRADLPPTQFDLTSPAPPRPPAPVPVEPESFFDTMSRITREAATVAGGMDLPVPDMPNINLPSGFVSGSGSEFNIENLTPEQREEYESLTPEEKENFRLYGVPGPRSSDPTFGGVTEAVEGALGPDPIPDFAKTILDAIERYEQFEKRGPSVQDILSGRAATSRTFQAEAEAADAEAARAAEAARDAAENLDSDEKEVLDTDFKKLLDDDRRLTQGDGDPDPDDLEALAQRRIELYRRLFGEDEPTPRDKNMQLAMIGLAIAAGQSPDALTNIAQGALTGLQAVSAEEAARRERDRELRTAAVSGVLSEQASARKETLSQRNERLERFNRERQEVYMAALNDTTGLSINDPIEKTAYAQGVAEAWARTNYPDLIGAPATNTVPTNAQRLTTREQVQELAPGTKFIWTDGREYTRS